MVEKGRELCRVTHRENEGVTTIPSKKARSENHDVLGSPLMQIIWKRKNKAKMFNLGSNTSSERT